MTLVKPVSPHLVSIPSTHTTTTTTPFLPYLYLLLTKKKKKKNHKPKVDRSLYFTDKKLECQLYHTIPNA